MPEKHPEYFLNKAVQLAKDNMHAGYGGPFGALVVKEGKIIGSGGNLVTSNHDPTAHAEIMAIRRASQTLDNFDLSGCSLYTSCEPCPMCLGAVYWARLDEVYFAAFHSDAAEVGFDDQWIYKELEKPMSNRALPFKQLLHEEGKQVFKEWWDKPDKMMY